MPNPNLSRISLEELAELLTNFEATQVVDLGSVMLHIGINLREGPMLLVNTVCGQAAMMLL